MRSPRIVRLLLAFLASLAVFASPATALAHGLEHGRETSSEQHHVGIARHGSGHDAANHAEHSVEQSAERSAGQEASHADSESEHEVLHVALQLPQVERSIVAATVPPQPAVEYALRLRNPSAFLRDCRAKPGQSPRVRAAGPRAPPSN